jgi:exosortase/archaeosortase family protein
MRLRSAPARFVLGAALIAGVLYGLIYYPYRSETVVVRGLSAYLRGIATASAAVIALFDPAATARGARIEGQFPLEIVLDCSAADAQALFLGAVLAFPVEWRRKAIGALLGVVGLNLVNVARIAFLYFIGVRWPRAFHTLHEEVIQILLVLVAAGGFAAWARWAAGPRPAAPQPAPEGPRSDCSAEAAASPR